MTRSLAAILLLLASAFGGAQTTPPAGQGAPANSVHAPGDDAPAPASPSQAAPAQGPYTLQTGAKLVQVPSIVSIKGKILYGLRADQFEVTDDGVPQKVTLDEQVDALGLSLVVVLQCSRSAVLEYGKIEALPDLVGGLVGGAPHEIALVRYGSQPELVQPFTRKLDKINESMRGMGPCDDGNAATIDAVSYAASILQNRPDRYRRAILLVGESRDHGSKVKEANVIAQLGRTNIVVDSIAYSPLKNELGDDLKHGGGPGPIGLLIEAIAGLRKNAAKSLASLSGGDYFSFGDKKAFDESVGRLTNRIHNFYLLSFPIPNNAESGLHEIHVRIPEYPEAKILARRNYWAGDAPPAP